MGVAPGDVVTYRTLGADRAETNRSSVPWTDPATITHGGAGASVPKLSKPGLPIVGRGA